jgi:uncharacterized membrane protein HdeD (DUF308 family)
MADLYSTEHLSADRLAGEIRAELRSLVPWWLPLTVGVLSVVFGLVVWIWPGISLLTFAVLVGLWLLVIGVSRLAGAFVHRPDRTTGQQVLSGVVGVLYVIGGVVCLRHIAVGLVLIAALVALQWLLTGVADIALGMDNQGPDRVWLIVGGVLALVLGIVFLSMPALSLSFFVVFTAISALVLGVVQIVVAVRLRSARR